MSSAELSWIYCQNCIKKGQNSFKNSFKNGFKTANVAVFGYFCYLASV